ncbi:MAG: hypothetical protein ACT4P9_15480 [Betaproteobacteria bacterium]
MKAILIALCLALALAACSKVTQENYARIQDGMTEPEVHAILGKPDESSSVTILGLSGTSSIWTANGAVITIQFANGKLRLKSFDKPAAAK